MNREQTLAHMRLCREIAERGEPLSMADLAIYDRQRREEMARAEAIREGTPQLPLVVRE